MTFTLPAIHNSFSVTPASNARWNSTENSPTSAGVKTAGGLPITSNVGDWERDKDASTADAGYTYEFQASQAGYDVSTDTKIVLWHSQSNAPNRIQLDSIANRGYQFRLWTGAGSPPTPYRSFYIGGNDSPMAASIAGQYPFVIDLNNSDFDASVGTFDNTDITTFSLWIRPFGMAGNSSSWVYQAAMYLLDTTKSSSSTPTFTGTSTFQQAVDLLQGSDFTNKLGNWIRQIGSVIFMDMPFRIGDNSIATDFDDEGLTIVSAPNNDTANPNIRVTTQAFRTYLNLRNNVADTALFTGTYIWGTRAAFDWDQDDSAVVTFTSPTFIGMGTFTLGSSITGAATWDNVDSVIFADTGVNVNGSIFKNQNSSYALEMTAGAMNITDMRFESYASKHAILIDTSGTYNFDNVFFDQSGTNDIETTHAAGTVTINISNGGTTPTVTETGAGAVVINNNVSVIVTCIDAGDSSAIQNVRVSLEADSGGSLPSLESVTITRSGSTATVTHTAHGIPDGTRVIIRDAVQTEYNISAQVTVTDANTYTYTVSGTPTTPATGTITATSQIIDELTNVSGIADNIVFNYTSDQPVTGRSRKGTISPLYKTGVISGTISSTGLSIVISMVSDE